MLKNRKSLKSTAIVSQKIPKMADIVAKNTNMSPRLHVLVLKSEYYTFNLTIKQKDVIIETHAIEDNMKFTVLREGLIDK